MKVRSVGAELSYLDRQTDGRTDATKLLIAFRNFISKSAVCNLFLYFFPDQYILHFSLLLRIGTTGLMSCYSL